MLALLFTAALMMRNDDTAALLFLLAKIALAIGAAAMAICIIAALVNGLQWLLAEDKYLYRNRAYTDPRDDSMFYFGVVVLGVQLVCLCVWIAIDEGGETALITAAWGFGILFLIRLSVLGSAVLGTIRCEQKHAKRNPPPAPIGLPPRYTSFKDTLIIGFVNGIIWVGLAGMSYLVYWALSSS